jgi:sulfite reductase beta subunit-like hemoprotein
LIPFSDLAAKYSGGVIRLLRSQDILLPRVHSTALPYIYEELQSGNLSISLHASLCCKIVSCIGAEVCKIGILDSAKFASELSRSLDIFFEEFPNVSMQDKLQVINSIRISGCPNSCSGHPAVPLGFEGLKRNIDGQFEPCFRVFVGGCLEGEKSRLAVAKENFYVPAKHLQAFVKEVAAAYLGRNDRAETFSDYVSGIGPGNISKFYKF